MLQFSKVTEEIASLLKCHTWKPSGNTRKQNTDSWSLLPQPSGRPDTKKSVMKPKLIYLLSSQQFSTKSYHNISEIRAQFYASFASIFGIMDGTKEKNESCKKYIYILYFLFSILVINHIFCKWTVYDWAWDLSYVLGQDRKGNIMNIRRKWLMRGWIVSFCLHKRCYSCNCIKTSSWVPSFCTCCDTSCMNKGLFGYYLPYTCFLGKIIR